MSPNIIAVACGLAIAMVPPVQKMLFDNPVAILRPLGAALQVCALRQMYDDDADDDGNEARCEPRWN